MGDVFAGRYELVDPLGEGGAGVVWRVWDFKHGRYCAAKVLRQVDAASLLRFMREQSFRLDHPHVLAPTGWAGEDDKVLFTMPIVRGGSVATLVNDFGPLPARLSAVLLDQLLAALEAIHAEGIVHRDVKPANLLLDATGRNYPQLWLGDFGIAAGDDAPRLTQGPFSMGTPGYVAPECLTQGWQPDARVDLYAAGMCALEMLTGLTPEADADVRQQLSAAQPSEPVPPELAAVVADLGHAAIAERCASAEAARKQLRATGLLNSQGPEAVLGEVEIFDHIPELPEGWGPDGPAAAHAPGRPTASTVPAGSGPPTPRPQHQPAAGAQTGSERAERPGATDRTELLQHRPEPTAAVAQHPGPSAPRPQAQPVPPLSAPQTEPQHASAQPPPGQAANPRSAPRAADGHAPSRRGQGVAIAMILMGTGVVFLAVTLYLALG